MMEWTDCHCRYFHRVLSSHVRLYTEMITAQAIMYGDLARHLDFDSREHPVALQLGGSEPMELAKSAAIGERWGYDEINLNCGCPSERVQRGSFGACLMTEPNLVADCVKAMVDCISIPVTVKHRIGIDRCEDYEFVRDFVGTVAQAGCATFIVHARNAWLHGLSPKENREIPPLRYETVYRLKKEFPEIQIVLNGGLTNFDQIDEVLQHVDGIMLGREAYHNPYLLAAVDDHFFRDAHRVVSRRDAMVAVIGYTRACQKRAPAGSFHLRHVVRHLLGLYHGQPAARAFRRLLSDASRLAKNDVALLEEAMETVEREAYTVA